MCFIFLLGDDVSYIVLTAAKLFCIIKMSFKKIAAMEFALNSVQTVMAPTTSRWQESIFLQRGGVNESPELILTGIFWL